MGVHIMNKMNNLNLEVIKSKIEEVSEEEFHEKNLRFFKMLQEAPEALYAVHIVNSSSYQYEDDVKPEEYDYYDLLLISRGEEVELIPVPLFYEITELEESLNELFIDCNKSFIPLDRYKMCREFGVKVDANYISSNPEYYSLNAEIDGDLCEIQIPVAVLKKLEVGDVISNMEVIYKKGAELILKTFYDGYPGSKYYLLNIGDGDFGEISLEAVQYILSKEADNKAMEELLADETKVFDAVVSDGKLVISGFIKIKDIIKHYENIELYPDYDAYDDEWIKPRHKYLAMSLICYDKERNIFKNSKGEKLTSKEVKKIIRNKFRKIETYTYSGRW